MSFTETLLDPALLIAAVLVAVALQLLATRIRFGVPLGRRGALLRAALAAIMAALLFVPVVARVHEMRAEADRRHQQTLTEFHALLRGVSKRMSQRLEETAGTPPEDLARVRADAKTVREVLNGLLDVAVTSLPWPRRGAWHLGVLAPTPGQDGEVRLRIVAASRVLRNDDAINFSMVQGEGVGGKMWKEWIEHREPRTSGLGDAHKEDAYLRKELIPPRSLDLTADVSACGVCVELPAVLEDASWFSGMLCLGSSHPRDFMYFETQAAETRLFILAREVSTVATMLVSLQRRAAELKSDR